MDSTSPYWDGYSDLYPLDTRSKWNQLLNRDVRPPGADDEPDGDGIPDFRLLKTALQNKLEVEDLANDVVIIRILITWDEQDGVPSRSHEIYTARRK